MFFRMIVTGYGVEVAGYVRFDVTLQWSTDEVTWGAVPGAPDALRLSIGELLAIATGPGTKPEKLILLQDRLIELAQDLPEVRAVSRIDELADALPEPPVEIPFEV